MRLTQV